MMNQTQFIKIPAARKEKTDISGRNEKYTYNIIVVKNIPVSSCNVKQI